MNIFEELYDFISYWRINEDITEPDTKDLKILLNQYISILSVMFFFHTVFNVLFLGLSVDSVVLLAISVFFCLSFFFLVKLRENKYVISFVFILLTVIVTYYSSYCAIESGVFVFYIPLISALYIFFSWKAHKKFITVLLLFILANLYLFATGHLDFIEVNNKNIEYRKTLLVLNMTCILLLLAVNSYFFQQKIQDYYFISARMDKGEEIANLNNEVKRLKKMMNKNVFTEEALKELLDLIQINDQVFIEKFESYFPDFFYHLRSLSPNQLMLSDLKICALLKMGFTSKQIAIYNNSSIKSVEGKIYRLRKKFNIAPDRDSRVWFSGI
ncbi:helix-turn-helix transcriptional regulator [Chryseobacterium turcicum]|uniref:HTH luxR-type domain-containing protein n=1 Tax=Chryseobacterium turcicum TaxID=2898076 RepID=A0A9Q3YW45_9FLAO|nr:hypothetical protein [Chryseobacterium turcicum]MCD1117583.1 hypothetical protein [Chryseobacterium turcicum]